MNQAAEPIRWQMSGDDAFARVCNAPSTPTCDRLRDLLNGVTKTDIGDALAEAKALADPADKSEHAFVEELTTLWHRWRPGEQPPEPESSVHADYSPDQPRGPDGRWGGGAPSESALAAANERIQSVSSRGMIETSKIMRSPVPPDYAPVPTNEPQPPVTRTIKIAIASLAPAQDTVNTEDVREKLTAPVAVDGYGNAKPPTAWHTPSGAYVLSDGHHRVAAAWARGETFVRVAVKEQPGAT